MTTEARDRLIVFGYIRNEFSSETTETFPSELIPIICDYANLLFRFVKRDGCNWQVSNNGLTATSSAPVISKQHFNVLLFGPRLFHQNKTKMEVTFRLDKENKYYFGIGFVTPSFRKFERSSRYEVNNCFMYGNGYFVYDQRHFKCSHKSNTHVFTSEYFHILGDKVTLSIDMNTKIAKFQSHEIHLPDAVQIAVTSSQNHVITVLE